MPATYPFKKQDYIYSTTPNKYYLARFKKKLVIIALTCAVIFIYSYFDPENPIGITKYFIAAYIFFLLSIITIQTPFAFTEKGILVQPSRIIKGHLPWEDIKGIEFDDKKREYCILFHQYEKGFFLANTKGKIIKARIPWAMIEESQAEVMKALRSEFIARGIPWNEMIPDA